MNNMHLREVYDHRRRFLERQHAEDDQHVHAHRRRRDDPDEDLA